MYRSLILLIISLSIIGAGEATERTENMSDDAIALMMTLAMKTNGVSYKGISIEKDLYNVQYLDSHIKKGERSLVLIIPQTSQNEVFEAIGFSAGMFKEANNNPTLKANLKHLVISVVDDNDTPIHAYVIHKEIIYEMLDGKKKSPEKANAIIKKWIRLF